MRAVACSLIVALVPTLCLAESVEFTFTGVIDNAIPGSPNLWNGPGPEPSTFTMTFDVDTLSPLNSFSYTVAQSATGARISSITCDLAATDFTVTIDGKPVVQNALGSFAFSGTPLGGNTFIGGSYGAGNQFVSFLGVPDFHLGIDTPSALAGSSDPLGLLLANSGFNTDEFTYLNFENSRLAALVGGTGAAVSVPEPGTLALLAMAAVGLGLVHRRRLPGAAPRD